MLKFSKYQGTGNDFIMIDNRNLGFDKDPSIVAHLCHRRFGIGADGLILLENSEETEDDFKMVYFNSDGQESTMCGNGGRCIVKFAQVLGIIKNKAQFSAIDGCHQAIINQNLISLKMRNIKDVEKKGNDFLINSGSPHYITFVENISTVDVAKEGRLIRNSEAYKKEGINVNFIEITDNLYKIRTYERGVEGETYSCGTGVTAAALALYASGNTKEQKIHFKTMGGKLSVSFQKHTSGFKDIWLIGPAEKSFIGEI